MCYSCLQFRHIVEEYAARDRACRYSRLKATLAFGYRCMVTKIAAGMAGEPAQGVAGVLPLPPTMPRLRLYRASSFTRFSDHVQRDLDSKSRALADFGFHVQRAFHHARALFHADQP